MSQNQVFHYVENFELESLENFSIKEKENFEKFVLETNSQKRNILHVACIAGVPQAIRFLIDYINRLKGNSLEYINAQDNESYTPLHYCIQSCDDGMPEVVELLIENQVDINIKTNTGETALHMSSNIGQEDVVKALIKSPEVNINIQNNLGETPLMQSIQEGQFHIFNILMGREELDINIKDKYGYNCAHHAAITKGNSPVYLRALATSSANLNALDNEDNTPILQAAQQDYKKFYRAIETLAQLNVDLEHQNKQGLELKDFVQVEEDNEKSNDYYSILYKVFLEKGYDLNAPKSLKTQQKEQKQDQEEQKQQEKEKGEWEIKADVLEEEKKELQQELLKAKQTQEKLKTQKFDQQDLMYIGAILPLLLIALYLTFAKLF